VKSIARKREEKKGGWTEILHSVGDAIALDSFDAFWFYVVDTQRSIARIFKSEVLHWLFQLEHMSCRIGITL